MIKTGVPQGSALGPFLFPNFINDLPQHITNAHSNIFADDSVIYTMGKSANETRAVRIVTGIFDFIANLMENLEWHSFDNRRDYFTATMMFKCINGLASLRLINELNVISDAHSANTRAYRKSKILVPVPHVEQFGNSFKYRGAVL